jgi:dCMP deaminase
MKTKTVSEERERQYKWDKHWLRHAKLAGENSKCLSRKIGSVLVKNNHIITSGYNGPAKGVEHCDTRNDKGGYTGVYQSDICPRKRMGFKSGEGMEHCPAVHAEANAIVQAALMGVSADGSTLYCWCPTPCSDCAKEIINAGVKRVVCLKDMESRPWGLSSKHMFNMAGVKLTIISEEEVSK